MHGFSRLDAKTRFLAPFGGNSNSSSHRLSGELEVELQLLSHYYSSNLVHFITMDICGFTSLVGGLSKTTPT